MIEVLASIAIPDAAIPLAFSFGEAWDALVNAVAEKRIWAIMTNPYIIGVSVLLFALGIFAKSKALLMLVIGMWGYISVYHFFIESRGAGDVTTQVGKGVSHGLSVGGLAPVVFGFLGFIVVTGILLYFGFIKGD